MPVHYCLGIDDRKCAQCADPRDFGALVRELKKHVQGETFAQLSRLPSLSWEAPGTQASHLVAQLTFADHDEAQRFLRALKSSGLKNRFGFGQDPLIATMDSWSPIGAGGAIFGNRDMADDSTGVSKLRNATGKGVNVIIVDRGLERTGIADLIARMKARRGMRASNAMPDVFGWTRYDRTVSPVKQTHPGMSKSVHGHMIARNVLAIAPEATIWDAPLLPLEDEHDAPPSPSSAACLFHWIKAAVHRGSARSWDNAQNKFVDVAITKPLVVVNAWGVFDPESDEFQDYADDPDHVMVNDLPRLDEEGIDIVFAAGNCGEPCPDRRCGIGETGPGRSIFGMNAHPNVLSVGAVRADGVPVALSAQGPGRLARRGSKGKHDYSNDPHARQKPDICAPSQFREADDASEINTGTSAACGYAAGVLAALRSVPEARNLEPSTMRDVLRRSARKVEGQVDWDPRAGFGIINAEAALAYLRAAPSNAAA